MSTDRINQKDSKQGTTIKQPVIEKKEPMIYIGPTIPGIARKNQVFIAKEVPKELRVKMEKEPAIKALIVTVSQLAKANQQIKIENTALNVFYKKALKHMKKGD